MKTTGMVGYKAVAQKFVQGTVVAAQPLASAPHSQVGALAWTLFTWK